MMVTWEGAVSVRVQRGVDLLDAKLGAGPWPWWNLVDLDAFFMTEWESCVLGQVASWYDAEGAIEFAEETLDVKDERLWEFGFNVDPECFIEHSTRETEALENVWREVIEGRQRA